MNLKEIIYVKQSQSQKGMYQRDPTGTQCLVGRMGSRKESYYITNMGFHFWEDEKVQEMTAGGVPQQHKCKWQCWSVHSDLLKWPLCVTFYKKKLTLFPWLNVEGWTLWQSGGAVFEMPGSPLRVLVRSCCTHSDHAFFWCSLGRWCSKRQGPATRWNHRVLNWDQTSHRRHLGNRPTDGKSINQSINLSSFFFCSRETDEYKQTL